MKLLDKLLPTSFDVTLILVVSVYFWTLFTNSISFAIPLIVVGFYYLTCLLFIVGIWLHERQIGLMFVRLVFAGVLVIPAIAIAILFGR